jgi:alpha-N-arabinofuranosidase
VIKVNYADGSNTLLVKLTGAGVPEKAVTTLHTITASAKTTASLERPNIIAPVTRRIDYTKDLTLDLEPFTVMVIEIRSA